MTAAADVTVLGDGAAWVWNLAAAVVPQATGVLALYHAVAHVAGAARAVWGAGTPARTAHLDAGRSALLRDGKAGLERWLGEAFATVPAGVPTDPLLELAAYFAQHPTRLGYAERLARGRSLGSGLVEGRLHQRVNLRRKRTGARGRVEHVGPRVELIALLDGGLTPAKFHRDTRPRNPLAPRLPLGHNGGSALAEDPDRCRPARASWRTPSHSCSRST